MKIIITLSEALHACDDWGKFCEMTGYSEYAVKDGAGDLEVTLTREQAEDLGLIVTRT